MENTPTEEAIRQRAINISKAVKRSVAKQVRARLEAKYQHERKLIESVFDGKDVEGKRLGVYIRKEDGKWFYELRGNLPWVNKQGELLNDYYEQEGSGSEGIGGNSAPSSASGKYETANHGYRS